MTEIASAVIRFRRRPLRLARAAPSGGLLLFVGILAYLIIVPLVRLQVLAFGHGARAYHEAFGAAGIGTVLIRTVELALGSLAIAVVFGTALAWAASTLSPRLRLLRVLPILPIVVPSVAAVLGWAFLLSPHPGYLNALLRHLPWWSHVYDGPANVYTLPWIVIITGLALTAFIYLFVSAGLENLNGELLEAAQVCGSNRVGVFFRVTLPLIRPSLVYGAGVALLLGLGQFTAPLILGSTGNVTVLTISMFRSIVQIPPQYDTAAALGSPLLVFGALVLVFNKIAIGDLTRFVTHGGRSVRPPARSSKLAALGIVLYGLVATVLPIVGLTLVGLSHFWSGELHPSQFTLANFSTVFKDPQLVNAIKTSLTTSVIAVGITIPLGFVAASVLRKRGRFPILRPVLDVIVAVPLSIPAVIFGVGFLLTYTHAPFILYGTKWVLVLVYITLMMPFSTRMQLSGMASLGDAYAEASRVSGAGLIRTNLRIIAPLLRGTFGGAAALMFILLANEFAASLLVRSGTIQVMGTILYDYYGNAVYPTVACMALIMIGITAAGVVVAMLLSGSEIFKRL